MLEAGYISATSFHTEWTYDYLHVASEAFSGPNLGPSWVYVSAGDVVSWSSDNSVTDTGWEICLKSELPAPHASEVQTFSIARNYLTGDTTGIDKFISLKTTIVSSK